MTATEATATVEWLSLIVVIFGVIIAVLVMMFCSAIGVIKTHKMVIEFLNGNIEKERKQKELWQGQAEMRKKQAHEMWVMLVNARRELREVRRGKRTDS